MVGDPGYKFYMSSVVMRIPGYNGDMEEPWYWEKYGRDIYEFSYYTDKARAQRIQNIAHIDRGNQSHIDSFSKLRWDPKKFNQLGKKEDQVQAKMYEKLIPQNALVRDSFWLKALVFQ